MNKQTEVTSETTTTTAASETPVTKENSAVSETGTAQESSSGSDGLRFVDMLEEDSSRGPLSEDDDFTQEKTEDGKSAQQPDAGQVPTETNLEPTAQTPASPQEDGEQVVKATAAETPTPDEGKVTETTPPITEEQWTEMRQKAVSELAVGYTLPEEAANKLITDPEKVLPQLLAEVHMNVYQQVVDTVYSQLPQVYAALGQQQMAETQYKTAFFDRWPELKEHEQDVLRTAKVYRQLNPQADLDTAIEEIGAHVALTKRIPLQRQREEPESVAVPKPFTPAAPGGSTRTTPTKPANKFTSLLSEFEEDM